MRREKLSQLGWNVVFTIMLVGMFVALYPLALIQAFREEGGNRG